MSAQPGKLFVVLGGAPVPDRDRPDKIPAALRARFKPHKGFPMVSQGSRETSRFCFFCPGVSGADLTETYSCPIVFRCLAPRLRFYFSLPVLVDIALTLASPMVS